MAAIPAKNEGTRVAETAGLPPEITVAFGEIFPTAGKYAGYETSGGDYASVVAGNHTTNNTTNAMPRPELTYPSTVSTESEMPDHG